MASCNIISHSPISINIVERHNTELINRKIDVAMSSLDMLSMMPPLKNLQIHKDKKKSTREAATVNVSNNMET